ncbi:MAG: PQQ-binding-like beta-propeller repeat protein [Bacteroidales bacterium]
MKNLMVFCLVFMSLSLYAQDNIQWRGTDRTGIYKETGLLKSWAADGPELLWHFDKLGEGHSSVAIANDKIYITGLVDEKGQLFVFDLNGKLLQQKSYGKEWSDSYNGARGTVTINDSKIYVYSGEGNLVCLEQESLNVLWQKSIINDFDGKNIRWGVNESPLIVDDMVIITPGGEKNNVVALNKNTGELIWSCEGDGNTAAYCSPLYIKDLETPQIVTITAGSALGIDAKTGKELWSLPFVNQYNIHPNTPIFNDNKLLLVSGYGKGAIMLKFTNGGRAVETVWEHKALDSQLGSVVKIGNYIYGSGHKNRYWFCLDWTTGEEKYKDNSISAGDVIAADGMLYCYSQKGEMALVKPTPEKFDIVSQFPITMGTEQHWAHPVIYHGVMYVRHGDTLMAYKIK